MRRQPYRVNRLGVKWFERAKLSRHHETASPSRTTPRLSRGLPFYASMEAGGDVFPTHVQRPATQAHIYGCASVVCILPATEILQTDVLCRVVVSVVLVATILTLKILTVAVIVVGKPTRRTPLRRVPWINLPNEPVVNQHSCDFTPGEIRPVHSPMLPTSISV